MLLTPTVPAPIRQWLASGRASRASNAGSSWCGFHELPQKMEGVDAQGLRDLQELYDIQAPLAAFEFRNIRLATVEPFSESRLGEAGSLSGLEQ
jgi:hypothetical protein